MQKKLSLFQNLLSLSSHQGIWWWRTMNVLIIFICFFFQLFKTKKKSIMVKKYSTFKLQHNQIGWWDVKDKNIFYYAKTKLKSHWFNPIGTIAFGGKIILTKTCALSFFLLCISTVQETDIPCSLYFHKGTKLLEFQ